MTSPFTSIQFEKDYDVYKMRQLVDDMTRQFQAIAQDSPGAGGGSGVTEHNDLTGRSVANAHPIAAITGLQTSLAALQAAIAANLAGIAALDIRVSANENDLDQARTQRYFLGE